MKTGFILIFLVFGVYLWTTSPTVTTDDSGELAGVCASLGIAHPSGYPVYSITGKIACVLLPFGNMAYRANVLSCLFGAATVFLICLAVYKITSSGIACVFSVLLLSFSKYFWAMSVATEVYTQNAFFAAVILLVLLSESITPVRRLYLLSFVFGVGTGGHHTIVFLAPAVLFWVWRRRKSFSFSSVVFSIVFFILGMSIYIFIPLRAGRQPLFNWEDPSALDRFVRLVLRSRYSGQLAQGKPLPVTLYLVWENLKLFASFLADGLTPAGFILFAACLVLSLKNAVFMPLFLFMFFSGPIFLIAARTPLTVQTKNLLERFVYLPFIPVTVLFAYGLSNASSNYRRFRGILPLAILLPVYLFYENFDKMNMRGHYIYYDYAKNILRTLPEGALLLSDRADEMEFAVAYYTRIEKFRQDVMFIDCNAGVSKSIYGDDYYGIWGRPRLERREIVEKRLIATTTRDVFYATFLPDQVDIPKYRHGLLYAVRTERGRRKGKSPVKLSWDEIYTLRRPHRNEMRSVSLWTGHFHILADYFLDVDEPVRAKRQYMAIVSETGDFSPLMKTGWWYFQKGDLRSAEKEYAGLLRAGGDRADVLTNLAVVLEKKGDRDGAEKLYGRAIEADPGYAPAWYNLGVIYWGRGDWENVVKCFEKAVKLDPEHESAGKYLAIASERLKK